MMPLVADIVKVEAPSQAAAGDTVIIDVHVKNLAADYSYIAVTGLYDSNPVSFQFDYLNLAPQETIAFRGWFTMPSKNVRVQVWSWYWDGNTWQVEDRGDDYNYRDIGITELVAEFANVAITRYEKL